MLLLSSTCFDFSKLYNYNINFFSFLEAKCNTHSLAFPL